MSAPADDRPRVVIASRAEWRAWLEANHGRSDAIWLVSYKKGDPRHVGVSAIVEEALCYGWIDSLPRKLDAERTMLLLAPRKPGSLWSALNKRRAEAMIAAGQMRPAGQAAIDRAKADGTWTALDAVEALIVPPDLASAFAEHPPAAEEWERFPRSVKRGVLEWIVQAKRPETRAKRVRETAERAARGERANQWRK